MYYLDEFLCGNDKYQDGAVVANNPAVVAMHEALRIWPERPIRVLISVGTGSTPPAPRPKAVSSFVEAGSMVIESATNVDRAHEALSIMRSLVPSLNYFRFDPVDDRCNMDLDEISSEKWEQLEAAADDYVEQKSNLFELAAKTLTGNLPEEKKNKTQKLSQRPANVCLISSQPFNARNNGENLGITACDNSSYEEIELSTWFPKDDNLADSDLGFYSQGINLQEKAKVDFDVGDNADQVEENPTQEDDDHATNLEQKGFGGALNSVFSWISPSKKEKSESCRIETHVEYPEGAGLIERDTLDMTQLDHASQGLLRTAALDHVDKLDRVLLYAKSKFQVLHFQMRTCDAGIILGWKHSYRAISVPSEFLHVLEFLGIAQISVDTNLPMEPLRR